LERRRVPEPLPEATWARPTLVLDEGLAALFAREQSAFATRQTIGATTAVGAALAPAIARAATRRGGAAAAARGAARIGTAARVGPAAAGGAAVCSPGGPVAALCAVLAGAAAWLATDWALIELDETLHRDELERTLRAALDELRVRVEADLEAAYGEVLAREQAYLEGEIRRTFVPAAAGRRAAGDEEGGTVRRAKYLGWALLAAACSDDAVLAQHDAFVATEVAAFDEPWAMTFLPDGRLLVTEKRGRLKLWAPDGTIRDIAGVPRVAYGGQ